MMKILKNKSLKGLNTFNFDVSAAEYAEFGGVEELREILRGSRSARWYVLSGGSNILFTGDFDGLILHPADCRIAVEAEEDGQVLVRAGAGVVWDDFVVHTLDRGWYGLENLSWIPGLVGASPVQNIGAYGVEVKDRVESVEVYLPAQDRVVTLTAGECRFGYRDSIFKNELRGEAIVLSVLFRLSRTFEPVLKYANLSGAYAGKGGGAHGLREVVIETRNAKLPDPKVVGNGGSFFKNPVVGPAVAEALLAKYPAMPRYDDAKGVKIPAGWLIEQAGWKGYREGDAGVYEKQALVLVNHGSATPKEVLFLANAIINDVREKFGILIAPEINIV